MEKLEKETIITVESLIYEPNRLILSQYGKLQQSISRILFNLLRNNEKINKNELKKNYLAKYQIKGRLYNSILSEVESRIQALKTQEKNRITYLETKIEELETEIEKLNKKDKLTHKEKTKLYWLKNKLNNRKQRLNQDREINAVWGSKSLQSKQYKNPNKEEWNRERNHLIYSIGSKDETFGNSLFQLINLNKLRLTLNDNTIKELNLNNKYLHLNVDFNKDKKNYQYLKNAIDKNQALTYRIFERENGKWYCQISFKLTNECKKQSKAIGVDINYNLIASCLVKEDGNTQEFIDYKYELKDKSKQEIKDQLVEIIHKIVNHAKKENANIIIEKLDLKQKLYENKGTKTNRKLHLLPYTKFIMLLKSKCVKEGVLLVEINPAYTSIIGRLKYSLSLGRSVHSCASYCIGRRGLGKKEKGIPSKLKALLLQSEEKSTKHHWSKWNKLFKRLKEVLEIKSLATYYKVVKRSNIRESLLFHSGGSRSNLNELDFINELRDLSFT